MEKKISAHIAIILILVGGLLNVYIKASSLSCGRNQLSAFAADDTYSWESVSKDDLVTAFKYYCKSRNLAIEGSVADAVTSFTTSTFNNICNTLGIDSDSLQAELKKTTGGNLGLRFLFTQTGVNAYNRIFAEFLQNNDLGVGDSVDDLDVYEGDWFDDGNNSGFIFITTIVSGSNDKILKFGDKYIYSGTDFNNLNGTSSNKVTVTVPVFNDSYDIRCWNTVNTTYNRTTVSGSEGQYTIRQYNYDTESMSRDGYLCIQYVTSTNKYYLASYTITYSNNNKSVGGLVELDLSEDEKPVNSNIYVTTNNNTINNNNYDNNYTIIYNDGDVYYNDDDDDDEPSPTTPPGGGGGGGEPDPDEPPIVDPTPTPDPTVPDWDIELPQMPVGNEWLLYGLEKKFPWDIPFNLMYMLSLFAADPETPHFQGTLDLKVVQWDYDIDLAPFDDIARNFRNFEFVGFIIGLMLLTRKLIWG